MDIVIKPLTPELTSDYFDFLDNRAFTDNPPWGGCYCTSWQMTKEDEKEQFYDRLPDGFTYGDENFLRVLRDVVIRQIESGSLRGYLAYADGISIGWCNVNDKAGFPAESANGFQIHSSADKREKAVVCFEISPEYRGKGVASALLKRAAADAEAEGYDSIEGYPQLYEGRFEWDYTGPVRLYEKAGFVSAPAQDGKIVMKKELK